MNKLFLLGIIILAGLALFYIVRQRKGKEGSSRPSSPDGHQPVRSTPELKGKAKRLFAEHLQAFERAYLAYLLEKEALARDLPMATLDALAQQYGTNRGDPPYRPNLDLPAKGVPSQQVTQLMEAWLVANGDRPSGDPPAFRIRRVIKSRLDRRVAEICDKDSRTV